MQIDFFTIILCITIMGLISLFVFNDLTASLIFGFGVGGIFGIVFSNMSNLKR